MSNGLTFEILNMNLKLVRQLLGLEWKIAFTKFQENWLVID